MVKRNHIKGDSGGRVNLPDAKKKPVGTVDEVQERKIVVALYPPERTTIGRVVLNRAVTGAIKQRAAHK